MRKDDRLEWCLRMQRRIARNVEVHPRTRCWLWTARCNNNGYPVLSVRVDGRHVKMFAHRASWEAFRKRRMPSGRVGAHSMICVDRRCCNPMHVRATTQCHNERDKHRKRRTWPRMAKRIEFPPTHTIFSKR